jgi:hypothetical protein
VYLFDPLNNNHITQSASTYPTRVGLPITTRGNETTLTTRVLHPLASSMPGNIKPWRNHLTRFLQEQILRKNPILNKTNQHNPSYLDQIS